MSLSRKLFVSSVYGQLPIITQVISGLIVMPLMIRHFGDRYFGIWVLAGTFLGYFGLLDFGLSKAIIRYVSRAIGRESREESDQWISIGLTLMITASIIGLLMLLIILKSLNYFVSADVELFRQVILIVGISFLFSLPSNAFLGILQAHVRGDIVNKIIIAVNTVRIVTFLILLYNTSSFILFVYILGASKIIQSILLMYYGNKIHGGFTFRTDLLSKTNFNLFFNYSIYSFFAQLADLLRFEAYPILISYFLGVSSITHFQIANRIRIILGQVHNKILGNFTPVFSQIEGKFGIGKKLLNTYLFSYKLSIYIVVFSVGVTAIIAPYFINVWVGAKYNLSITLLFLALIGNLAAGIQIPVVCYLFGTSKHRYYALTNGIEAILIISSSLLVIDKYGLIGMVTAASASTFIVKCFLQPLYVIKELKITFTKFYIGYTLKYMIYVAIFLWPSYYLGKMVLRDNYFIIGMYCFAISILYFIYIWLIGFNQNEKQEIVNSLPILKKVGLN